MRRNLLIILAIYAVLMLFLMWLSPKKMDWSPSFSERDKIPYGSKVLREELPSLFPDVETETSSLFSAFKKDSSFTGNYIYINPYFNLSDSDLEQLLYWVEKGNNAFIASNQFSDILLDTLNLSMYYPGVIFKELVDESQLRLTIMDETIEDAKSYAFAKEFNLRVFEEKYDSIPILHKHSMAYMENDERGLVYISKSFGKGRIFLHSVPYVFTNYYMLFENNAQYISDVFSHLPQEPTKWDEYYKIDRSNAPPMRVFLSNASFKWAFIFGVILLFLFILLNVKRNQRAIPIVVPPENRSLEFTQTMGDLYFNTQDRRDIVQKMERHFREYLKEKYAIYDLSGTSEEFHKISLKSGRSIELISSIYRSLTNYKEKVIASDNLIKLNHKLHQFYYGGQE